MTHVLLLSNGHGEDLSGALLGAELLRQGIPVEALPLVGHGEAYRVARVPLVGSTVDFSTGGIGYTSLRGRLTEIWQGQVFYLLRRLTELLRRRRRYRLVVVVGDVIPVMFAWLSGCAAVVYLVAYSSHYEGRLRLPWPCGALLRSRRFRKVLSRDALTAEDLSGQLGRKVSFLGNPFLDVVSSAQVVPRVGTSHPDGEVSPAASRSLTLTLLPGSRLPEALRNLELMLRLLPLLPQAWRRHGCLRLQAAMVRDFQVDAILVMALAMGWQPRERRLDDLTLGREEQSLRLVWGHFPELLVRSDLVLSMTGTAAEQAVGLALPVLQLAGHGPQFTVGFAEAQRRLLGPSVVCAPGPSGAPETLRATAKMAADLLDRLSDPQQGTTWRRQRLANGRERIGPPGGTGRMVGAIMESLPASSSSAHAPGKINHLAEIDQRRLT